MNLNLRRFSPQQKDKLVQGSCVMSPSPIGDWVRYDEVVKLLENTIKHFEPTKCGYKVEIEGTNGIAHTYCQRPTGHEGKCSI